MPMKNLLPLLALVSVSAGFAADKVATDKVDAFDSFSLTPDYRSMSKQEATMANPFRKPEVRATIPTVARTSSGPNIDAVRTRINEMALSGVIPTTLKHPGLVVIGGNIFHLGDELKTYDPKTKKETAIVPEHKVTIRSITGAALEFDVMHITDPKPVPTKLLYALLEFRQR